MRSRDWSSAVCSPDLVRRGAGAATRHRRLDWPARDPVAAFLPLSAVHRHAGRPADLCRTARAGAALTQSHHTRTPLSTETADPRYTDIEVGSASCRERELQNGAKHGGASE